MAATTWIRGGALGLVLGALYAASPMSLWFVIAMAGVFAWAGRGLGERERLYVWGLLLAAIAVRVLAVVGLVLVSEPNVMTSFFWDGDGVYLKTRAAAIREFWIGTPISPVAFSRAFDHGYGWSSYLYVLAYLQYLIGPSPFGVHLFNISVFVASAVILHRLVRPTFGRAPALLGLGVMLFLPTLIAWSVSALKESLYLFLNVLALRAAVSVVRSERWSRRLAGAAIAVGAIAANGTVRTGAGAIMMAGLGAGFGGRFLTHRWWITALVIVLLPFGVARLWNDQGLQTRVLAQINAAATQHRGAVHTEGGTYQLLEPLMYRNRRTIDLSGAEASRYVGRAVVSFLTVPLPWQVDSKTELLFLAQQVIWYLLAIFAVVGLAAGLRRDPLLTWVLCGVSVVGAAAVALNSGNIGSLVRFRDTVTPFLLWLSALGAVSVASECLSRGRARAERLEADRWTAATLEGRSS